MKKNIKRTLSAIMATAMLASCAGVATFMNVAAEGECIITINHPDANTTTQHEHNYVAKQIFKGEYSNNVLINLEWGDSISKDNALKFTNELRSLGSTTDKTSRYYNFNAFTNNEKLKKYDLAQMQEYAATGYNNLNSNQKKTVDEALKDYALGVAEVLSSTENKFVKDSLEMFKFAKLIQPYLNTSAIASANVTFKPNDSNNNGVATLSLSKAGYYMFYDESSDDDASTTAYILRVVGNTALEINPKADMPTLDKVIVDDDEDTKVNTASIGDTIHYKITSKVPDMTGYNKFFFNISDTLDETLDFQEINDAKDNITVKITNGTQTINLTYKTPPSTSTPTEPSFYVTADSYYTDGSNPTTVPDNSTKNPREQNIKIVLENFIQYRGTWNAQTTKWDNSKVGWDIIVEYDAVLMENAKVGDKAIENEANLNTAKLIYSNDPNVVYNGKPTKPYEPNDPNDEDGDKNKPKDPIGETVESVVATFTTELDLIKVDNKNQELKGAEFEVKGEGVNVVVTIKNEFEVNDSGEYYKLNDGTYTKTSPFAEGIDQNKYASMTTKYAIKTTLTPTPIAGTKANETAKEKAIKAYVGNDGILKLTGLGEGTYTITETEAPAGYNKLTQPLVVKITAEVIEDADPTHYQVEWKKDDIVSSKDVTVDENGVFKLKIKNNPGSTLPSTGGIGTTIFYVGGSFLLLGAAGLFINKKRKGAKSE